MERAHKRAGTGKRRREVGECSRLGPSLRIATVSGGWEWLSYTLKYTHVERLTYTMASAGCVTLLLVAGLLHEEVVVQDRSSRVFAFLLRVPGKRIGR